MFLILMMKMTSIRTVVPHELERVDQDQDQDQLAAAAAAGDDDEEEEGEEERRRWREELGMDCTTSFDTGPANDSTSSSSSSLRC